MPVGRPCVEKLTGGRKPIRRCERRAYDSRCESHVRDHPYYRADDSVWRIFSADIIDEQEQQVYGKPIEAEFFSRRTRPCGRNRDSLAHLPDVRGCGSATHTSPLVCSNRHTAVRNSDFGGISLFGATTDCDSSEWSRFADLFRSSHSCNWSYCTCHWIAAISTNCVDGIERSSTLCDWPHFHSLRYQPPSYRLREAQAVRIFSRSVSLRLTNSNPWRN
jgi:hypothetical protein